MIVINVIRYSYDDLRFNLSFGTQNRVIYARYQHEFFIVVIVKTEFDKLNFYSTLKKL